ncbi:MAG TPA: DUF4342 domain-containing protein [Patescibacteria group bacterium]|nr:DUF4342 domain-containing protein [Patescibacteria group bacterium]
MTRKTQRFPVSADKLVAEVKKIVAAGNARHIRIESAAGKKLLEFSLTVGTVGAVLGITFFPVALPLAALGAIAMYITDCVIVVEYNDEQKKLK